MVEKSIDDGRCEFMNTEELDRIRLEDIEFFAQRYSQLFGKHFDKNTPEEIEKFREQIKQELLEKVSQYAVVEEESINAMAESLNDRIEFSREWNAIESREVRIHELFHSYNHIERKHGLKDFDSDCVLRMLDEGSTEMFAQMMCGNERQVTGYSSEVEYSRFVTGLVGERTMIRATRGNPQLLCETIDELLDKQGVLQEIEDVTGQRSDLIAQSMGVDSSGRPVSQEKQILSELKLEAIRGKDSTNLLFDKVLQTGKPELYNTLIQTENKFGYGVSILRLIRDNKKDTNLEQPTLADIQQKLLQEEIEQNSDFSAQGILKNEIYKFLYDRITYQRHFLDRPEPKYGSYKLTDEDKEYSENFQSDLDSNAERLGGKFGLYGPGVRIYPLQMIPYMMNEGNVRDMYIEGINYDELKGFRLELWAEKLNIAQMRQFIKEWAELPNATYVFNIWYSENFPEADREMFREDIEGIKKELDEKEKGLIDKYKAKEKDGDFGHMPQGVSPMIDLYEYINAPTAQKNSRQEWINEASETIASTQVREAERTVQIDAQSIERVQEHDKHQRDR